MEAFQKKINLMKRKINNIKNDIECIREDEKTNTNNHPHPPLTTNNHSTKTKPPYTHNEHRFNNNTSKQISYKKYLFIPRSKTAQTTISNEEPSLNIPKQLPQSRTKYNSNNNSICNSNINNNNNTTTNNSIAYNFDYKLHNHSIETSFPLRKYNSHNNSARKHLSNSHHKHLFKTKNKKDLFRRQTPLPNTIDITNSSSLNPERVFSPIHNISTTNNNNSTYTKVSPYTLINNQPYHKRNKTSSQEHFNRKYVNDHYTRNTRCGSDNNAEHILMELIDISNEYYGDVSPMFVVENYKRLLRENKTQNEFIMRLQKLYLNCHNNGKNSGSKRKRSGEGNDMVEIWKWVNGLVRDCNGKNEGCVCDKGNEYQLYCEGVMKEYGLKNINEFSGFLNKLLKKSNKNDNFLEGIKKILMVDNKIEEYHK